MVDWVTALPLASFNGLFFHVATSEAEAGHRVSTTPIPNGHHVNESFGPAPRKITVTAYCLGAACYLSAEALIAAAETQHLGLLVLPDGAGGPVRLIKATRKFDKDKLGYAAVDLEAVAEPAPAAGGFSAFALAQAMFARSASITSSAGAFVAAGLSLAGQPAPVISAAVESAAGALGDLVGLRLAARLDPAGEASVEPAFAAAFAALPDVPGDPAAFGAALAGAAVALGDAADPAFLLEVIGQSARPADPPPPAVSRGTAQTIHDNAVAAQALAAAMRAVVVGEAMARREYRDRFEGGQARALAAAIFDDALSRLGRAGLTLAADLSALRGLMAERVAAQISSIAPVITVSVPASLPSLWVAWRLYADPRRAAEVADRAGVGHPSFMPLRFEAVAA